MKTITVISVVLCSFVLFHSTLALPLEENRDITIDAAIQSNAHVEVPGSVAEDLLKAMIEAFQQIKVSKEVAVQVQVSVPDDKPVGEVNEPQGRGISCNLGGALCSSHCVLLGHIRGGYCNSRKVCICR
uniref:Defensin-C n=1 Tax=Bactrocera dorsalis TaxID=27457 RepID=A0A034WWA1_BACDO